MNKKNKKLITPLLGQVFQKVAPRIGARVIMEPKWNIVGQIIFKNGRKRYFRYSSLDLNTLGSSEIARDKDYANFFMDQMGYPIIPGSKTFFSDRWARIIGEPYRKIDNAYKYALKLGFPVIVKPNSGSQGLGVALVHNKKEFYRAMNNIFKFDRVAIVQERIVGKDYRLVVVDKKVISVYERIPLSVVGDGKSNILRLLKKKQQKFVASSRDTQIKIDDPRIVEKLKYQGLTFNSILEKKKRVFLLDNANLSAGGESIDVTKETHSKFKKLAVQLTRDMGLRLCGVDLMIDGVISEEPEQGKFWILEINSAPGLDHYAKSGKAQEKIVENLYLKILKSMEKSNL